MTGKICAPVNSWLATTWWFSHCSLKHIEEPVLQALARGHDSFDDFHGMDHDFFAHFSHIWWLMAGGFLGVAPNHLWKHGIFHGNFHAGLGDQLWDFKTKSLVFTQNRGHSPSNTCGCFFWGIIWVDSNSYRHPSIKLVHPPKGNTMASFNQYASYMGL